MGNIILDWKGTGNRPEFLAAIQVGTYFFLADQAIRIVMYDPCNTLLVFPMGTIYIARYRVSDTQWQMEQQ
jgi:hypothetical protein